MHICIPSDYTKVSRDKFDRVLDALNYVRSGFANVIEYKTKYGAECFGYEMNNGDCYLSNSIIGEIINGR